MDQSLKHRHPISEPVQLVRADDIFARLARLDISLTQQIIGALLELAVVRPNRPKPGLELFGERPQAVQVVGLGGLCRAAYYAAPPRNVSVSQGYSGDRLGIVIRGGEGMMS